MQSMRRRGRGGVRGRFEPQRSPPAWSRGLGRSEAESARGGTYRVGWESTFGWSDSMDPTGEYLANFIAIWTNLLGRNLVGYNHVAGAAGNVPVPDLATSIPSRRTA